MQELEAATGCNWITTRDRLLGSPTFLQPDCATATLLLPGADPVQVALDFMTTHAGVLGMDDPTRELKLEGQSTDALGMTHVMFTQQQGDIPVWGTRTAIHFDRDGGIAFINSRFVPDCASVDTTPALSQEAAQSVVVENMASWVPDAATPVPSSAELVIYGLDGSPRLAWNVVIEYRSKQGNALAAIVDSTTGEVITTYNAGITFLQGSGGGVRYHGIPDSTDVKSFEVKEKSSKYLLIRDATADRTKIDVRTCTANGEADDCDLIPAISSTSLTSGWDDVGDGAGQAVDAAYNLALVDEYYRNKHGRASWDGAGASILAIVHHVRAVDNAGYLGNGKFGFGNIVELKPRLPFVGSLDSVAHEFQHAVTGKTLRLAYSDQSGAIDEGLSDIFGMLVEHEYMPGPGNFKGAEQTANGAGNFQSFEDPSSIPTPRGLIPPDHMNNIYKGDDDWGGVHVNSTIVSHTWYLLIGGGRNRTSSVKIVNPIGWDDAGKLAYSVVVGGGIPPKATFEEFARATIASAKQLPSDSPSSNPVQTVACAWFATGVLKEDEILDKWKAKCERVPDCFGGGLKCDSGTVCSWNGRDNGYCCRNPFTGTVPCVRDDECSGLGPNGICALGDNNKYWCTTVGEPPCVTSE